jgi:hypothetical protein
MRSKSIDPNGEFYSAQVARIDASAVATVAIDRIVSLKQSQGIPPWFIPPPIAPGQMVRLKGRGLRTGETRGSALKCRGTSGHKDRRRAGAVRRRARARW